MCLIGLHPQQLSPVYAQSRMAAENLSTLIQNFSPERSPAPGVGGWAWGWRSDLRFVQAGQEGGSIIWQRLTTLPVNNSGEQNTLSPEVRQESLFPCSAL